MDHSPLAKLPRELRDEIYKLALSNGDSSIKLQYDDEQDALILDPDETLGLALLTSCKEIRAEVIGLGGLMKLFYGSNDFCIATIATYVDYIKALHTIATTLGPDNLKATRSLTINPATNTSDDIAIMATRSAIVQLHPLCMREGLALGVSLKQTGIEAVLDMLSLRSTDGLEINKIVASQYPELDLERRAVHFAWLGVARYLASMYARTGTFPMI